MAQPLAIRLGDLRALLEDAAADRLHATLSAAFAYRSITPEQEEAWRWTARWLHQASSAASLASDGWLVLLEYTPPLITKRPDVVVVTPQTVLVVEVKSGLGGRPSGARKQVLEYARDLYWYHPGTRTRGILPVAVTATGAADVGALTPVVARQPALADVVSLRPAAFADLLDAVAAGEPAGQVDDDEWASAQYAPRPAIVDAAVSLVAANDDPGLNTPLASDQELERIARTLTDAVAEADSAKEYRLLLVVGVPGAGKTLIGLRLAHDPSVVAQLRDAETQPLFLTGNGPLVKVLTEALARDHKRRHPAVKNADARREASTLVRLVHAFSKAELKGETNLRLPHVCVFDEGQRVWNEAQMTRQHRSAAAPSEPETLLRNAEGQEWAVFVVLVGEGQEINTGEDGAHLWIAAAAARSAQGGKRWRVRAPRSLAPADDVEADDGLVLNVGRRSAGASWLSEWVTAVLGDQAATASRLSESTQFPLYLTRDLESARHWLREADGRARYGLVASSRAARLRPYGIETDRMFQEGLDWPAWFLDRPPSVDSSTALETVATEFKCQGLELDYSGLCWSWDLVRSASGWEFQHLRALDSGRAWRPVAGDKRRFGLNAYRVLLTRARSGLVIWVPRGDDRDPTRPSDKMDEVARYLRTCGVVPLPAPPPSQPVTG